MQVRFNIPQHPKELLQDQHQGLRVSEELSNDPSLENKVLNELRFKDCLCLLQQDTFDALYGVIRNIEVTDLDTRSALCDVLNINISLKASQIANDKDLADSEEEQSCLKAYLFFLWWFWEQVDQKEESGSRNEAKGPGLGKRRRKDRTTQYDKSWNWKGLLHSSLEAASRISQMYLSAEGDSEDSESTTLPLCLKMAVHALKAETIISVDKIRREVANTCVSCMMHPQFGLPATSQLVALGQKLDHVPEFLGEVCEMAVERGCNDVVQKTLEALTLISGDDLSSSWSTTKGKSSLVRLTGKMIDSLANHVPGSLRKHWALLDLYWDCSVHLIRNCLVSGMGKILMTANKSEASQQDDVDNHHILSFQRQALDILMERIHDGNTFTRVRVLGVWTDLVQEQLVPPRQFVALTITAIRRLEDTSVSVQKSALALLTEILRHNPFSGDLRSIRFREHLEGLQSNISDSPAISKPISIDGEESDCITPVPGIRNHQIGELIATLEAVVRFSEAIESSTKMLIPILMGTSVQAIQEVISYATACHEFQIEGTDVVLKRMLSLVFSSDMTIRQKVLNTFQSLYIVWHDDDQLDVMSTARNLVQLTTKATVGDMRSLEEVIKQLTKLNVIPDSIVMTLLLMANGEEEGARDESPEALMASLRKASGALQLLIFCAANWKKLLHDHVDAILQVFTMEHVDGTTIKHACRLLGSLGPIYSNSQKNNSAITALVLVILNEEMPETSWYGAAEAAVGALFSLCNEPEVLGVEILHKLLGRVHDKKTSGEEDEISDWADLPRVCSKSLSRFFYLGGCIALTIMCHWEEKIHIKQAGKAAQEKKNLGTDQNVKPLRDRNCENGSPVERSGALDGKLDEMMNELQKQIMAPDMIVGRCAKLVSSFCTDLPTLLSAPPFLQSSALHALTKFMGINGEYCEKHLRLIFTLVKKRELPICTRKNLVFAIQDFVQAYPNLLDPWTGHVYSLLDESDQGFRADCLRALIHLMLNNLIKVKIQVSKVAALMQDQDQEISRIAKFFFSQLAKRTVRNVNPIANLLPEILSNLLVEDGQLEETFEPVMQQLLQYTSARNGDRLVEKMCQRLQGESNPKVWKGLAFTIKCLSLTEKGVHQLMELIPLYRHTLGDSVVIQHFQERIAKSKRLLKSSEMQSRLDKFSDELIEISVTLAAKQRDDYDDVLEEEDHEANSGGDDDGDAQMSESNGNEPSRSQSISLFHHPVHSTGDEATSKSPVPSSKTEVDQDMAMADRADLTFPSLDPMDVS